MASHGTAWHSPAQPPLARAAPGWATPRPRPPSQARARPYHIGVLLQRLLGAIILIAGARGAAAVQPHQGPAPVVAGEAAVWGRGQDQCHHCDPGCQGQRLCRGGYWCPVGQGLVRDASIGARCRLPAHAVPVPRAQGAAPTWDTVLRQAAGRYRGTCAPRLGQPLWVPDGWDARCPVWGCPEAGGGTWYQAARCGRPLLGCPVPGGGVWFPEARCECPVRGCPVVGGGWPVPGCLMPSGGNRH